MLANKFYSGVCGQISSIPVEWPPSANVNGNQWSYWIFYFSCKWVFPFFSILVVFFKLSLSLTIFNYFVNV
ncbi:hypothetical protein HanRHA438_Chr10g0430791 [Helianthus annuus]|nr:hypothetical protein HanRHA438_Chr10g0430791 [Helianthus annuus]